MNKVLVVCPLKKELNLLKEQMSCFFTPEKASLLPYWQHKNLSLAVCGLGKAQSATQTSYWIQTLNPDVVICCGASGSLSQELLPGSVIAGSATIEHDFREGFKKDFPLPEFFGDKDLLEFLAQQNIKVGRIASGDEDVVSQQRANDIREKTQAICVAWEGAGVARATRFHQKRFLELRAITDSADHLAPQHFEENLKIAMHKLGQIISLLIES